MSKYKMRVQRSGLKKFRPNPTVTLRVGLGFNSNLTPIDPRFHKCVGQLELLVGVLSICPTRYDRQIVLPIPYVQLVLPS
jgi:hypothetical protein